MPEFPELMGEIEAAVGELGGCVAPKLNWSSPHDAAWVSADRSLACRNAEEVRAPAHPLHAPRERWRVPTWGRRAG